MLPPKLMLRIIRSELQRQLKKSITCYEMHYDALNNKVFFIVEETQHPMSSELVDKIGAAIEALAKDKLEGECTIDYVILYYEKDTPPEFSLFYKKEGKKQKIKDEL